MSLKVPEGPRCPLSEPTVHVCGANTVMPWWKVPLPWQGRHTPHHCLGTTGCWDNGPLHLHRQQERLSARAYGQSPNSLQDPPHLKGGEVGFIANMWQFCVYCLLPPLDRRTSPVLSSTFGTMIWKWAFKTYKNKTKNQNEENKNIQLRWQLYLSGLALYLLFLRVDTK